MKNAILGSIGNLLGIFTGVFILEKLIGHDIHSIDLLIMISGVIIFNQHLYGGAKSN